MTGWTDQEVEVLKTLWSSHSATEIARILHGKTRNSVLAKIHRLGMSATGEHGGTRAGKSSAHSDTPRIEMPRAKAAPLSAEVIRDDDIPAGDLVATMDLRPCHCRWPIGDPQSRAFGFCGKTPQSGSPYCAGHHRRSYDPAKKSIRPAW